MEAASRAVSTPFDVRLEVADGDVILSGRVESTDIAELIVAGAERVPGVLSVRSDLNCDDGA